MGCGASDYIEPGLTITLINRSTNTSTYLTGEHVECLVKFDSNLYDPDEELKGAFIELQGQLIYTTTTTHTNSNGSTYTTQHSHRIPFFTAQQTFYAELTQENPVTIAQFGKHNEWFFEFTLPDELPASLPSVGGYSNSQPYVVYFIRVVLELKRWYQNNIKHSIPITIYPRINIPNHLYCPTVIENENRKHVRFRAIISRGVILPGIPLSIHYDIHNPNQSTVQAIIVKLCQTRNMDSRGFYRQLILEMDARNENESNEEQLHENFELTLPAEHLPPTSSYTFNAGSGLTQCNPASITYEIIIELKMSGFFTDFSLKCPIIMGIELNENSPPPPSYASAIKLS